MTNPFVPEVSEPVTDSIFNYLGVHERPRRVPDRIAASLGVSEHTVKRQAANVLLKLGLPSRAAAAALAARAGLV